MFDNQRRIGLTGERKEKQAFFFCFVVVLLHHCEKGIRHRLGIFILSSVVDIYNRKFSYINILDIR